VTTVLLVRHGLTAATGHTLSGWTPGIPLDDRGRAQARALGTRLARLPLDAIVTSPLDRCRQTAEAVAAAWDGRGPEIRQDERLGECRYGDWTGKPLRKLVKEPLWRVVQAHPSAVRFPGPDGESMLDTQHRAVAAVREWNATLGPKATYLICSHGDVIKGIIADCLGLHLDLSQRIQADPCSLTVIRYTPLRPFLLRMNDTGGGIEDLMPRSPGERDSENAGKNADRKGQRDESDAVVGGGAGANPDDIPAEAQTGPRTGARTGVRTGTQPGAPAVREPSADARG
jgi:probable phosphomutase (TIGR03848 family)